MKARPEFGGRGDDPGTRAAKIRALFTRGATIEAHTDKCFNAGVWTEAENAAAAMAHHRNEVREALREEIDGLPWAGETGRRVGGKPVWRQMDLWEYEDFAYNIQARIKQTRGDVEVLNRIIALCMERFGRAPVKRLAMIEVEDEPDGD